MLSMEEFATNVKEELEELTGTPVVYEKMVKCNNVIMHGLSSDKHILHEYSSYLIYDVLLPLHSGVDFPYIPAMVIRK